MGLFACSSVWQMNDGQWKQFINICTANSKDHATGIHINPCEYRNDGQMAGIVIVEADCDLCGAILAQAEE